MAVLGRQRSTYQWPITLSVVLIGLNLALMVCWIVLFVRMNSPGALTMGVIAFALILIGLSFWLFLTIKEIQLNHRQANFVDSVTHELKSPIASLRAYLETMQMRSLSDEQRAEFYGIMERELTRLDELINHLLEVGRLDAIGQETEPEDVLLEPLLRRCAEAACWLPACCWPGRDTSSGRARSGSRSPMTSVVLMPTLTPTDNIRPAMATGSPTTSARSTRGRIEEPRKRNARRDSSACSSFWILVFWLPRFPSSVSEVGNLS